LLTARAENFLVGRPDLGDAIERLRAHQQAGANVLWEAPRAAPTASSSTQPQKCATTEPSPSPATRPPFARLEEMFG